MPQLPTSTAEEYGAEDEIKEYNQEEDDCSDSSTVDVVNDIKDDLLNEDGHESAKTHEESLYRSHHGSNRFLKGESTQGLYGSPAAVIVGPHRYYDQSSYRATTTSHSSPSIHGNSYSSGTQIRMPMYPRDERSYYEQGQWPPSQVTIPGHSYPMHSYGGGIAQKYSGFRYPPGVPPGVPYYMPGHGYPGMPGRPPKEPKRPHVKKPLNAFMLYMKEQRPKIAAEFTLKESAAINQILGKRWHALDKSEQAKYYEMARKERAIHMQLYPGWSARDNYAQIGRKKKRPRDKNEEMNPKKCRARYGLDRQEQWCKPCRRKKKCIRFLVGADGETREISAEVADQLDHSDSDENNPNKKENRPNLPANVDNKTDFKPQELLKVTTLPPNSDRYEKYSPISNNNNNNNNNNLNLNDSLPPSLIIKSEAMEMINPPSLVDGGKSSSNATMHHQRHQQQNFSLPHQTSGSSTISHYNHSDIRGGSHHHHGTTADKPPMLTSINTDASQATSSSSHPYNVSSAASLQAVDFAMKSIRATCS